MKKARYSPIFLLLACFAFVFFGKFLKQKLFSSDHSTPSAVDISNFTPAPGETVTVRIAAYDASTIQLTSEGEGCGDIVSRSVDGSMLEETEAVGLSGECHLKAHITTDGQAKIYTGTIAVYENGVQFP
ncbi:MAG: hypothetical protein KGI97_00245 [Alphaproteobacteria bacterium]|nr:hypothetical protein [Alphaproteobacteria bacterium]